MEQDRSSILQDMLQLPPEKKRADMDKEQRIHQLKMEGIQKEIEEIRRRRKEAQKAIQEMKERVQRAKQKCQRTKLELPVMTADRQRGLAPVQETKEDPKKEKEGSEALH
jgi:peptidoglycan hydrolase CwlO-like protein